MERRFAYYHACIVSIKHVLISGWEASVTVQYANMMQRNPLEYKTANLDPCSPGVHEGVCFLPHI